MSWLAGGRFVLPWLAFTLLAGGCGAKEASMQTHDPVRRGVLAVDDVTGFWRIAPTTGAKSACLVALNSLVAPRGYQVHVESCSIQPLASAQSWRPADRGFELLNGSGQVVAVFRRVDIDSFRAVDGSYRMERAAGA